jgi:hypothetical protein
LTYLIKLSAFSQKAVAFTLKDVASEEKDVAFLQEVTSSAIKDVAYCPEVIASAIKDVAYHRKVIAFEPEAVASRKNAAGNYSGLKRAWLYSQLTAAAATPGRIKVTGRKRSRTSIILRTTTAATSNSMTPELPNTVRRKLSIFFFPL